MLKLSKLGKKAATGESMFMVIRITIISLIALVVLGTSAIAYNYYIDVKNMEAIILARDVVNCLASNGIVDLDNLVIKDGKLLENCGIKNTERFYVSFQVINPGLDVNSAGLLKTFTQGDSGALWVRGLFIYRQGDWMEQYTRWFLGERTKGVAEQFITYTPGYYSQFFELGIKKDGKISSGVLHAEVLVNA